MVGSRHILVVFSLVALGCSEKHGNEVTIESGGEYFRISLKAEGHVNHLQCFAHDSLADSWPLHYPVFKLVKGDIDHDGNEDIGVGVTKTTRRDSVARKRLFIYQVRNRSIIPLWLGSSLSHPMEDFTFIKKDSITVVRSIEFETSGKYLVAEYEWFGFGLSFREYLNRELSLENARELLDQ